MQEHQRAAAAAAPMPAGWRARRKHEAKLMHLADTYGPMCRPFYDRGMEEAFQDVNGFVWFIEVTGGPTWRITKDEMPEWFVSLPAAACGGN